MNNFYKMLSAIEETNESVDTAKFLKVYDTFEKNFPMKQQENPKLYEENFYIGAIASILDELSETDKFWSIINPTTIDELKKTYNDLRGRLFRDMHPELYDMWRKEQTS